MINMMTLFSIKAFLSIIFKDVKIYHGRFLSRIKWLQEEVVHSKDMTKSVSRTNDLQEQLWGEVLKMAIYNFDRVPINPSLKTFELWTK